jgi:hypothetical protein
VQSKHKHFASCTTEELEKAKGTEVLCLQASVIQYYRPDRSLSCTSSALYPKPPVCGEALPTVDCELCFPSNLEQISPPQRTIPLYLPHLLKSLCAEWLYYNSRGVRLPDRAPVCRLGWMERGSGRQFLGNRFRDSEDEQPGPTRSRLVAVWTRTFRPPSDSHDMCAKAVEGWKHTFL